MLCMGDPNCILLKALDLRSQTLHVVIVDIWYPLKHYLASIGGFWHKFPAGLPHDIDWVVIMVVSDQAFRLVGCPSYDILRHVYTCRVGVPSLYCVFTISPDTSDRITEDEFLKTPFPEYSMTSNESASSISGTYILKQSAWTRCKHTWCQNKGY